MVEIGGKRYKLVEGKENRELAEARFHELMLTGKELPESVDARVFTICDEFLEWSERNQAQKTYDGYRFRLQRFCEAYGKLRVDELRPFHVDRWIKSQKGWKSTNTRFNAVRSVIRAFNWAVKQGILKRNPLAGMQRPPQQPRTTFLPDDTLKKLVRASNPAFKVLLFALRETGARPSEVCNLNWTDVQTDHWRLGKHKTYAKTGRPRVIVLSRRMQKLMPALQKRRSTSKFVFVNTRGEPWTTDAIRSQMKRLKAKLGIKGQVCAYLIRHSFATNAVTNGVGSRTLAELMGHRDTQMIDRIYTHLSGQRDHLAAKLEEALGRRLATPKPTD